MTRPGLLMIGNYLPPPRYNRNVWHELADRLAARGWPVITVSSEEAQAVRLLDMLFTTIRSRDRYALAQVDVFSGRAFLFAELCTRLLNGLGKPVILTLHGGRLPEFAARNPQRVRRLLQSARIVVTPSPFLQKDLFPYCADIRLLPNPIDLSCSIYRLRSQPAPALVWVRSFHSIYNPSLAVRALSQMAADFPAVRLTMIGPEQGNSSLRDMLSLAAALSVREQLKVIPGVPHSEIPGWLDKSDIFINSSNYDTAPRSVIEAMGNGLCIVSTNVGGIPWLVENEQEALLVPPDDAQAMAAAVRRILTEEGLAARLSAGARQKSLTYDWQKILPLWEELFLEGTGSWHG